MYIYLPEELERETGNVGGEDIQQRAAGWNQTQATVVRICTWCTCSAR